DPDTGMWGAAKDGLLHMVNGFYRASRGTFAQFGVPLSYPERVIDTVLRHARDPRYVRPERQNACNILDIAHPLWLTRHAGYRAEEVTALAGSLLSDALGHWTDGQGFGFQAPHPATTGLAATTPGLQGTEMWLAIVWLLADLAGVADALGYRPRGVHRPEPAARWTLGRPMMSPWRSCGASRPAACTTVRRPRSGCCCGMRGWICRSRCCSAWAGACPSSTGTARACRSRSSGAGSSHSNSPGTWPPGWG